MKLSEENFLIYASKSYDKPGIIQSEFDEDLKRIKYIKRLLRRYKKSGNIKERLILNHIIIMSNVFGVEPTVNMLFFKLEPEYYSSLKSFLVFLSYLPRNISGISGVNIDTTAIQLDINISSKLMEILKNKD